MNNDLKIDEQNENLVDLNKICGIYCIYNDNYFYVGLSNNIKSRWNKHKNDLKRGVHNNHIMQQVYDESLEEEPFQYKIICKCKEKDLNRLEILIKEKLCSKYPDRICMNIANCGGRNNWTEQMKENAKISHTGKPLSEEHRKRISEGQKGCKRLKQRVKIVQLDLNGNLIKIWDSISEACDTLHIHIQLSRKTSGGFQWQKYEIWKNTPKEKLKYDYMKAINQYSKSGEFIKSYNSIQEASDITGIRHCNISNTLTGKQKSAGGFIWKYQN